MPKSKKKQATRPVKPRREDSLRPTWRVSARNHKLIDGMLGFWQPRTDRALTREDGREIAENLLGFFRILHEWDRAERLASSAAESAAKDDPTAAETASRRRHGRGVRRDIENGL